MALHYFVYTIIILCEQSFLMCVVNSYGVKVDKIKLTINMIVYTPLAIAVLWTQMGHYDRGMALNNALLETIATLCRFN